ncbi:F-box-like protein [Ceratobasidium sp. AG-Ba]|nr:F-box-like protein [Ceratobasidium sp. AG-Ba]
MTNHQDRPDPSKSTTITLRSISVTKTFIPKNHRAHHQLESFPSKLELAMSEFFDACSALESVASSAQPPFSPENVTDWEQNISDIDSRIERLATEEAQLRKSKAIFYRLVNQSTLHAPITRLPYETLSHIFSLVVGYPACIISGYKRDLLLDIQQVCMKWRQTAIGNPYLWSHIDLRVGYTASPSPHMARRFQTSLNYSRGMTIQLHIDSPPFARESDLSEYISILKPHVKSLGCLEIAGSSCDTWARDIFQLCVEYGTPSSLETCILKSPGGVVAPGGSFNGLVDLSLSGRLSERQPDFCERSLAETLYNTPNLHTLRLINLWLCNRGDKLVEKIHLPCLRVLQLYDLSGPALELVHLLHPGSIELDVILGFSITCALSRLSALAPLLARSNVVSLTLHIYQRNQNIGLGRFLASTPRLRSLVLSNGDSIMSDMSRINQLEEFLRAEDSNTAQVQHLRSLCLINYALCSSDMDRLKHIVAATDLSLIGFSSCLWSSVSFPNSPRNPMQRDFKEWLESRIGEVVIHEKRIDMFNGEDVFLERFRRA